MPRLHRNRPVRAAVAGLAAFAAAVLVVAAPASAAEVQSDPITSPGPLTRVSVSDALRCQVDYNGVRQFYSECRTSVASGGTVSGYSTAWKPVSQESTGTGTRQDPYLITTTVQNDGWTVVEEDRYVVGQGDYDTTLTVTNTEATDRPAVVAHAADCYLQGGDSGYGQGDRATGTVTCLKNPPSSSDPGQVESFVPRTAGATFAYGGYGKVWDLMGRGVSFGNQMLDSGSTKIDNGMGISWSTTIAAGATETFAWQNHFLTGEDPAAEVTATGALDDADGNGRPDAGESVAFVASVANTGTVPLLGATVRDAAGRTVSCPSPIAVDASVDCVASTPHTLTQEDVDRGTVADTLTVSATTPRGASYTAPAAAGTFELVQDARGTTATQATGDASAAGASLDVVATVRNDGNVTLDDLAATVDGAPVTCDADVLAPGASTSCAVQHEVSQEEFDAGRLVIGTTAVAEDPSGDPVTLTASETAVDFDRRGAVDAVLRTVSADRPGVGDAVGLELSVTNTGNASVGSLTVAVDQDGFVADCPTPALAPGATLECDVTGTRTVTQADVDAGSLSFAATVSATDSAGAAVSAEARATRDTVAPAPAVDTTVLPQLRSTGTAPVAGDVVTLSVRASNTGNVTLHDLSAALVGRPALTVVCPATALAPGADVDCSVPEYRLTQDDVDAGTVSFDGTVDAADPAGQSVRGTDSAAVTVDREHGVVAVLSATRQDDGEAPRAGDHVALAVTVRNTGNTTLRDATAALDDLDLDATCADGPVAPGAELTCTVDDHVLTQSDVDAGAATFSVTVTADAPGGAEAQATDTASIALARVPAITTTATSVLDANDHEVPLAGDTATVTATVRNTGNVTVRDVHADIAGRDDLTVTCPASELAPGDSVTCSVPAVGLTQADVDAGAVELAVRAAATGAGDERATAAGSTTLTIVRAPAVAAAATSTIEQSDRSAVVAGDAASARLVVENTGNVTVHDLAGTVADRPGTTLTCPTTTLAPGRTATCTSSTHEVTQDEVDAGSVAFDLGATAVGADGTSVTATATTATEIESAPAVGATVVAHLAASEHDAPRAGDRVSVGVRVTNGGNVTLSGVGAEVVELADMPVTCPGDALAPGASVDCTAPDHVLTQADIDRGEVVVVAVLDATAPSGTVVHDRDEVRVGLDADGALDLTAEALVEDASGRTSPLAADRVLRPGDVVRIRYTIVNTGNLVVDALQQAEDAAPVEVGQRTLQPGERTTAMTTPHTVTVAEGADGAVVLTGRMRGQVTRSEGATVAPGSASTDQTGSSTLRTRAADRAGTAVRSAGKPVWVYSSEVRTTLHAESAPILPVLAFTGPLALPTSVAIGIVMLLLGAVLAAATRRRRQDRAGVDRPGRRA